MAHASTFTGGNPDGFLGLSSQRVSVQHIGSTWTSPLGHSAMLDMGSGLDFPQTGRWLLQTGSFSTNTNGLTTAAISFASQYSGTPPFVKVNISDQGVAIGYNPIQYTCGVKAGSVTSSGFSSLLSPTASINTNFTVSFRWFSLGTVVF